MLNICELQVESSSLPVSLPLLWLGTTTRNIYKTTEDPHFPDKEVESLIDNFLNDILLMVASMEESKMPRDSLIYPLQNLGFLTSIKNYVFQPFQIVR